MAHRFLTSSVRVATASWLILHFGLTLLYVLPTNPIKLLMAPVLEATIGSFFYQNWNLFAPNPIAADQSLMAHCFSIPVDVVSKSALPEDGWYDMSLPLWLRHQHHRFAAYDRLARPQTNAMRQYLTGSAALKPWLDSCLRGSTADCDTYKTLFEADRRYALSMLSKIGSSFCRDSPTDPPFQSFALRSRETPGLLWSKRYTAVRPHKDVDIGVFPVAPVVSTGLYRLGG